MRTPDTAGNGAALLVLLGGLLLVGKGIQAQRLARLRGLIRRAEQRFAGDVCSSKDRFARVESIRVEADARGPLLRLALATFRAERARLEEHRQQARRQLGKLHDFLGVPASLRPILNFDLDGLFDPQRLQALKASFAEVVSLHTTFTALSRQGLEEGGGSA